MRVLTINKGKPVYGLSMPFQIAEQYNKVYFEVKQQSNGVIILQSGCSPIPSKEEIKNFDLEQVRA